MKVISFIGIDGSGKTTYAKKFRKKLASKGYNVKLIGAYRGLGGLFPSKVLKKAQKNRGIQSERELFKQNSYLSSLLRFFALIIYVIDYHLLYFKVKFSGCDIVILDRYHYDLFLIKNLANSVKKGAINMVPNIADKVILLERPLKDLLSTRTFDIDESEAIFQKNQFKLLNYKNIVRVKTKTLKTTEDKISKILFSLLDN